MTTYYRAAYRIVNDPSGAGNLVRISCTSTDRRPHRVRCAPAHARRLVAHADFVRGRRLLWAPALHRSGASSAVILDSRRQRHDARRSRSTPNQLRRPWSSSGQRSNPGVTLPAPPYRSRAPRRSCVCRRAPRAVVRNPRQRAALLDDRPERRHHHLTAVGIADPSQMRALGQLRGHFLVSGDSTTCTFHACCNPGRPRRRRRDSIHGDRHAPGGPRRPLLLVRVSVPAVQSPAMTAVKTARRPPACLRRATRWRVT